MLWDTAGQEEFDAITKAYYRGKSQSLWQQFTLQRRVNDLKPSFCLSQILLLSLHLSASVIPHFGSSVQNTAYNHTKGYIQETDQTGNMNCFLFLLFSSFAGAQACVLVFSTTDRDSFQSIDSWREKVEAEVGDIPTVLVQNKIDLLEETVIKK